jgi:arylsulfatase A-like enzyme
LVVRLLLALGGSAVGVLLVALMEARVVIASASGAQEQQLPGLGALILNELGLLAPIGLGIGASLGVLAILLQPRAADDLFRAFIAYRVGSVSDRARIATIVPIAVFGLFAWTLASAHLARIGMAAGRPAEAGLTIGVGTTFALVALAAISLACMPLFRRLLSAGSESFPQLLDPTLTGAVAMAIVAVLFGIGIVMGDTSGANGGVLGIFGVLKRSELDLRPLANAALLAFGAIVAPITLARVKKLGDPRALAGGGLTIALYVVFFMLCGRASSHLGDDPAVVRGIEKQAPLGKTALAVLRKLSDHDKDGFSASYAGGDCNDHDKAINPNALDIPGNGIDEDCSGADTPAVSAAPVVAQAQETSLKPKRTFNVIFITVDTLRPDLGFMNYGKPTSPNLDKVAEKATIFDHAYSMASYTGKAVGPMLIGKYPSETITDFNHFNTYFDANTLVSERLKSAGVRTFAGMCHWYFKSCNLRQGFDVWDTSAIPPGMGDNDNVITSPGMADLALKLLKRPENVPPSEDVPDGGASDAGDKPEVAPKRFFAWFHFFDPHAQYVAHEGSPDFSGKGQYAAARALYDQEVWFTDKHIGRVLDYVASQPWGNDTAIIMTADHGEAFFEHGMAWHGAEIWEELIHVPLFVYVPGAEPRRVPQKRSHIDVVPTILELMGVPLPEDDSLRGKSLLDDVYLPKDGEHEERDVYVDMPQGPYNQPRRAVIYGPSPGIKLIHSGGFNYQLFDLSADPDEKKDLSKDPEKLKEAIARMNGIRGRLKEIEVKPK